MITGRGETEKDALIDHDNNLITLMKRCRDVSIRLNPDKMILRQNHVPFFGHIITADGLKPDPDKVKAIDDMPRHRITIQRSLSASRSSPPCLTACYICQISVLCMHCTI